MLIGAAAHPPALDVSLAADFAADSRRRGQKLRPLLVESIGGLGRSRGDAACGAGGDEGAIKDDPPEQLLAAIRVVADGDALLSPAITKRVIRQFTRIPDPAPPRELDDLTERELDVFRLIARGLSNAEIGRDLYISDTTVKTHITHILQKLSLRDRVHSVVLAYQTGVFASDSQRPAGGDETASA